MGRLRRMMHMERLETRSLLAAALGIADVVVDQATDEPQVLTSIEINNASGIRAATVEILYDQDLLQADLTSLRAGSIWEGKGVAIANLNDQDGKITAFIFATEDMSLSSGTLLDIDFMFNDGTPGDARAHVGLGNVRLNEGDIPISPLPLPGQKTVDGSITRQATGVPLEIPEAVRPPRQSAPPARVEGTVSAPLPERSGSSQQPQAAQGMAPVVPQMQPEQRLAVQRDPVARIKQEPAAESPHPWVCAPRPHAGVEIHQVATKALGQPSPAALAPHATETAGTEPASVAVGDEGAGTAALPVAALQQPVTPMDRPVQGLPDTPVAIKAKQPVEVFDPVRRQPAVQKIDPLFIRPSGSASIDRAGTPLTWLLGRRISGEPSSEGERAER